MYPPTQLLLSLFEPPAPPVVYDTPPVITRSRPLLMRLLDVLHVRRALARVVPECADDRAVEPVLACPWRGRPADQEHRAV
jgi:hypothetical protein